MAILGWIIFGFFAGLVARALLPGRQRLGFIATTLLGMAGAFAGGWLGSVLLDREFGSLEPSGFIGAVIGSMVLLVFARWLGKR